MRHAIIGGGNLGLDLKRELDRRGIAAAVFTRANGFMVEDSVALMEVMRGPYDVVWYCVGFGSVAEAMDSPVTARRVHVSLPLLIARAASAGKRLVFFSSDYAAAPELSAYAALKHEMELSLINFGRPQIAIVRVGSLVGHHKPEQTFPGRILRTYGFSDYTIRLPENLVTPTPSYWLAGMLIENFERLFHMEHVELSVCAPTGAVSVRDWATFILEGLRQVSSFSTTRFFDDARPSISAIGCSLAAAPHWCDVWKAYFDRAAYVPREHLIEFNRRMARPAPSNAPSAGRETPAS